VLRDLAPSGSARRLLLASGGDPAQVRVTTIVGGKAAEQTVVLEADHAAAVELRGADQVWVVVDSGTPRAAVTVSGTVEQVPYLSVLPLADAPVTALSVPVRQVGS
jgi:hypothetical protein